MKTGQFKNKWIEAIYLPSKNIDDYLNVSYILLERGNSLNKEVTMKDTSQSQLLLNFIDGNDEIYNSGFMDACWYLDRKLEEHDMNADNVDAYHYFALIVRDIADRYNKDEMSWENIMFSPIALHNVTMELYSRWLSIVNSRLGTDFKEQVG